MSSSADFVDYIATLDERRQSDPRTAVRRLFEERRWSTAHWVIRQLNLWGLETMARGKGQGKSSGSTEKQQWTTFVEISLAGHTREAIMEAVPDFDTVFNKSSELLQDGYRIAFSYNSANDAFTVSVTCRDDDSPNKGMTFTAFAGDWYTALQVALYKHYVVAEGDWNTISAPRQLPLFG